MAKEIVMVGCKLPNGLIIQVGDKRACLRGSAIPVQPRRKFVAPEMVLLDSLNPIDKELWDEFVAKMGPDYAPIKSGAIYAANNKAELMVKAKDREKVKTGMEPLPEFNTLVKKLEA